MKLIEFIFTAAYGLVNQRNNWISCTEGELWELYTNVQDYERLIEIKQKTKLPEQRTNERRRKKFVTTFLGTHEWRNSMACVCSEKWT